VIQIFRDSEELTLAFAGRVEVVPLRTGVARLCESDRGQDLCVEFPCPLDVLHSQIDVIKETPLHDFT
jgi:hypothetical protein